MNMAQKRAALAAINPTVETGDSLTKRIIADVAMRVGVVPSYTKGFFADIKSSYQYEEAKREGKL
jgi:hypothetical protein